MDSNQNAKKWLKTNWPNMKVADVCWTMENGNFPQFVVDYLINNWVKVNNEMGGTYCESEYYENTYKQQEMIRQRNLRVSRFGTEETKHGETTYQRDFRLQKTGMDKRNQKALEVLVNEGSEAAVKHMFTDDVAGGQLSYSEMRSRYG